MDFHNFIEDLQNLTEEWRQTDKSLEGDKKPWNLYLEFQTRL